MGGKNMKKMISVLALAATLVGTNAAHAETLALTGKFHWLLLASSKDKDQAIGIARAVSSMADTVKVITSKSGYFGVIAGPYAYKSIKDIKKADKNSRIGDLPKDAILTQGANYIETVWQAPTTATNELIPYSIEKTAEFSSGDFNVKINGQKLEPDRAFTVVEGKDAAGPFHFDIGKDLPKDELASAEEFLGMNYNQAGIVKLVPGSPSPQVVVTNYSGGAHCCATTTFISKEKPTAPWSRTTSSELDGEGYAFEDVNGDGAMELISVDNRFLYSFGSYAGSFAPIEIHQLIAGKIIDVSTNQAMRGRLVQDLAGMEYSANLSPDMWKQNGYLAGWVASKIRLGQGDEAWALFMKNYEKENGFGPQECTSGQKVADCPNDNLKAIPIPKALAGFLRENGYLPLPAAALKELN